MSILDNRRLLLVKKTRKPHLWFCNGKWLIRTANQMSSGMTKEEAYENLKVHVFAKSKIAFGKFFVSKM